MTVSTLAVENRHHSSLVLCELSAVFPLLPLGVSPALGSSLTYVHWSVNWIPVSDPQQSSRALSLVLCPTNSSHLDGLELPVVHPQLGECAGLCLGAPCALQTGSSLRAVSRSRPETPPIRFPPLRDRRPSLTAIPYLESYCLAFFICFSKESGTSDPSFSSSARSRSQESYLNSLQLSVLTHKRRIITVLISQSCGKD